MTPVAEAARSIRFSLTALFLTELFRPSLTVSLSAVVADYPHPVGPARVLAPAARNFEHSCSLLFHMARQSPAINACASSKQKQLEGGLRAAESTLQQKGRQQEAGLLSRPSTGRALDSMTHGRRAGDS
jgi:hypothetical protein